MGWQHLTRITQVLMLHPLQPQSCLRECGLLSFRCHSEDSETKWVRQWSNVLDPCHTDVNFRDYYLHLFCSSYVVVKGIRIQEFFSWSGLTLALLSNPSLCMQHIKAGCDQHCIAPSRFLPLQQGGIIGAYYLLSLSLRWQLFKSFGCFKLEAKSP